MCVCMHICRYTYMGTVSTMHPLSAHSTLLNYCMVRTYKYTCNHTEILCLCFLWSFHTGKISLALNLHGKGYPIHKQAKYFVIHLILECTLYIILCTLNNLSLYIRHNKENDVFET